MENDDKKSWGGARPNAGRPHGSRDRVSIHGLLSTIRAKSGGQSYEEILVEDFLTARSEGDRQLTQKYHHLISNKVMNTLAQVEVTDPAGEIEARRAAFLSALEQVANVIVPSDPSVSAHSDDYEDEAK